MAAIKFNKLTDKPKLADALAYLNYYKNDPSLEHYRAEQEAIDSVFGMYPQNTSLEKVLVKVTLLDSFYSTNLRMNAKPYGMAKHICSIKNLDSKIKEGDLSVVEEIANTPYTTRSGKLTSAHNYSFATKFCTNHQPDKFCIFDSFVQEVLSFYRKDIYRATGFVFTRSQIEDDYSKLMKAIAGFRKTFNIPSAKVSDRELDRYLWLFGIDYFN